MLTKLVLAFAFVLMIGAVSMVNFAMKQAAQTIAQATPR